MGTFTIYSCPAPSPAGNAGAGAHAAGAPGVANQIATSPKSAAPGAVVNLLYSCATKLNFGNLCCAPMGVAMYDMADFRKLHYVNARMKAGAGARAPLLPKYRLVSAADLAVTLPVAVAPGLYAFVVHNKFSDVTWAFLTVT